LTPFLVTPAVIIAADQAAYASTAPRYDTLRVIAMRVWACSSTPGSNPALTVTDAVTGMLFQDTGTIGGTNAAVAYVYPLSLRLSIELAASVTTLTTVAYGGGLLTLQVLVDFG
jgi:hypothetical protein